MLDTTASKNDRPAHVLLETPSCRMYTRTSHHTPHQQHCRCKDLTKTPFGIVLALHQRRNIRICCESLSICGLFPAVNFRHIRPCLGSGSFCPCISYATRSLHFLDSPDRMWDQIHLPLDLLRLILDLPVVLLGLLLRCDIGLVTVRIPKSG